MPGQNELWAKYGCDQCNDYPLLVLTVNFSTGDSKQSFQNWCNRYNVEYPAVCAQEGGREFNSLLSNNNTGGPQYLIYPDRTFKKYPSASDYRRAGIEEHECATHIQNSNNFSKLNNVVINSLSGGKFSVLMPKSGRYEFRAFNTAGRILQYMEISLGAGRNVVNFGTIPGVAILSINSSTVQDYTKTVQLNK